MQRPPSPLPAPGVSSADGGTQTGGPSHGAIIGRAEYAAIGQATFKSDMALVDLTASLLLRACGAGTTGS